MKDRRCGFIRCGMLVGAVALLVTGVRAQEEPIRWSLSAPPLQQALRRGDQVRVEVTARIDEGWHLYSTEKITGGPQPTSIAVVAGQPFELAGVIESPEPKRAHDANFGTEIEFYEKSVIFTVPLRFKAGTPSSAMKLQMEVRFQACNASICLAPRTSTLDVALRARK